MAITFQLKRKNPKTLAGTTHDTATLALELSSSKWNNTATPFVVTDLSKVEENTTNFKKFLPKIKPYYALKANSDPRIIQRLDKLIAGYDISSLGELNLLMKQGINASRALYSNPVKPPSHIKGAYEKGVRHFAFDSVIEIDKLAKYAPGSNVYLRLKVSDYGSKFPLSKKFGVNQIHAVDYCTLAKDAGLNVKGITFHVGSQSENIQIWKTALEMAGKTIEKLRNKGIKIEFLNLGGGFPADYGEPVPALPEVAAAITEGINKFVPSGIELLAEPGRYIVANTSILVASVIGLEHRSGADWMYLDVGTFQGLIEPLEMKDWRYPIYTDKNPAGYKKDFVLSGPTCDAYDTLGSDYLLPSDMNVGDRVYIGAVGAYCLVYASNFNGFDPPKVYYIND